MIQTVQTAKKGALIEIRRDRHIITGRVLWRDGGRAGVRCENPLPVEEILSLGTSKSLQLVAEDGALLERRYSPRRQQVDARLRGRALQFAGVVTMILALSIAGAFWVREAFARPLQAIEAALGS